jgi:hypothetical protein
MRTVRGRVPSYKSRTGFMTGAVHGGHKLGGFPQFVDVWLHRLAFGISEDFARERGKNRLRRVAWIGYHQRYYLKGLDVVPFVPVNNIAAADCVRIAHVSSIDAPRSRA